MLCHIKVWPLLVYLQLRTSNGWRLKCSVLLEYICSSYLHCALSLAVQCIVIGPVRLFVCMFVGAFVALLVCYHDNSKLHASIFTKLAVCG